MSWGCVPLSEGGGSTGYVLPSLELGGVYRYVSSCECGRVHMCVSSSLKVGGAHRYVSQVPGEGNRIKDKSLEKFLFRELKVASTDRNMCVCIALEFQSVCEVT